MSLADVITIANTVRVINARDPSVTSHDLLIEALADTVIQMNDRLLRIEQILYEINTLGDSA